ATAIQDYSHHSTVDPCPENVSPGHLHKARQESHPQSHAITHQHPNVPRRHDRKRCVHHPVQALALRPVDECQCLFRCATWCFGLCSLCFVVSLSTKHKVLSSNCFQQSFSNLEILKRRDLDIPRASFD